MSTVVRFLGARPVERVAVGFTARRLRVIAYHGVPDPAVFRSHLEHFVERYRPVSGDRVRAAVIGGSPLPARALWITFDDGQGDVIENGLPELERLDVPATLFVCPGLVSERRPFWWSEVERCLDRGPLEFDGRTWTDRRLTIRLKQVDDQVRRTFLAGLPAAESESADRSVAVDGIEEWVRSGRDVGNHTWDHPCLPRCAPDEQERQIVSAHDWLTELLGSPPDLFAYPNGDVSAAARDVLAERRYAIGLRFDHRLADPSGDPLLMSRLRLDSNAPMDRMRAISNGTHSGVFGVRTAVQDRLRR